MMKTTICVPAVGFALLAPLMLSGLGSVPSPVAKAIKKKIAP